MNYRLSVGGRRDAALAGSRADSVMLGILRAARDLRPRYLLLLDLVGIVLGAYLAIALRLDRISAPVLVPAFPFIVILLVSVRTIVNWLLGMYSRTWRFASVRELERIVGVSALGSGVAMAVFYGTGSMHSGWTDGFPRSFWPIELMLSVTLLGGMRFAMRAAADQIRSSSLTGVHARRRTLLYGAGDAGVLVARSAERYPDSGVMPVGFLDDNPRLAGGIVAGLRVFGGLDDIERAAAESRAVSLLITMPTAPGSVVRQILEKALTLGLDVRTVPPITDLIDGTVDAHRVRDVRVEDLLRRPSTSMHAVDVDELIRDKTVMITGGGGSIGSELARQVFALNPRRLVLVDRAESPLYLIQRELERRRQRGHGSGEMGIHLANVASRASMDRIIGTERPDVIFHAAAYKHVPMMEEHPSDAVYVNMGGTMAVLDAAAAAGVGRFVFVSTDKAVRPSSVMGASKRIGEMLVADMARRTGRPYVSVRFGNVLGSAGSVVPIFKEQLENGQPLTITHPDMTRYFMTIPEAVWLILDAAALGQEGDLFVLDMGEPVKVLDLANDLVRLSGRDPNAQPIEVIGLRPGEKLHEELFYSAEDVAPTPSQSVLRAFAGPPPEQVVDDVKRMIALANAGRDEVLRDALFEYVRAHEDLAAEAAEAAQRQLPDETPSAGSAAGESQAALVH